MTMLNRMLGASLCLAIGFMPVSAMGDVIANQNFDALSDAGTETTDTFVGSGTLTNSGSFNNGGPGIDFYSRWSESRGTNGPKVNATDVSDFIGVNSGSGSNAPNVGPDGVDVASGVQHNFEFNDSDGLLELVFEPVDVSGFSDIEFSLSYWIANGHEFTSIDKLLIMLSDGVTTETLLSMNSGALDNNSLSDNGTNNWYSLNVDVSALGLGNSLELTVTYDSNHSAENLFIDEVLFTGVAVPEPASIALMGLVAFPLTRRRRR